MMRNRDEWLDAFGHASREFRYARADILRVKRLAVMRGLRRLEGELERLQIEPATVAITSAPTTPAADELKKQIAAAHRRVERFRRLERGQRRRVAVVRGCGSKALRQLCKGCGTSMRPDKPVDCGHIRVCVACRGSFAARRRAAFRVGRGVFLRSASAWRLSHRSAPGGPWSDKFITLTVPHSGDPAQDARELASAYKRYRRGLIAFLQNELSVPKDLLRFPYVRVQEITASDGGHAHYHLWCFLPFIAQPIHSFLWSQALSEPYRRRLPIVPVKSLLARHTDERSQNLMQRVFVSRRGSCGRSLTEIPMAVVDVQAGRKAETELIKYLVKDAARDESGKLEYVEPTQFAKLYAALEGRRTIQTSAGFWAEQGATAEPVSCSACGTVHGKGHRPNCQLVPIEQNEKPREAW